MPAVLYCAIRTFSRIPPSDGGEDQGEEGEEEKKEEGGGVEEKEGAFSIMPTSGGFQSWVGISGADGNLGSPCAAWRRRDKNTAKT